MLYEIRDLTILNLERIMRQMNIFDLVHQVAEIKSTKLRNKKTLD